MKSTAIPHRPQANRLLVLALTSVLTFAGVGLTPAAGGPGEVPPIPDLRRLEKGMECLGCYGVHAKAALPGLREMRRPLKDNDNQAVLLDKTISTIEAATDFPTLVDLKDFKTRP